MVTVADVLADPGLELAAVHVPKPDLDVRWVATSELPDPARFFEGGEIVLSTGLQTPQWTQQWQGYVDALLAAGTVAIGLGVGLTHEHAPAPLVAACRRSGFNLFEVPRQTPFVAVTHRISRLLAEQEEEAAREALAVQRRLTAAAARPDGVGEVVAVLAGVLGGNVTILAPDGAVLLGPPVDLTAEIARLRERGARAATTLSGPDGTTVLQPIGVSRRASYLAGQGPPRLSEVQRSAVTTAVALLGLIAEQQRNAAETRRRLGARAVGLLVAGDAQTAGLVLGIDPSLPPLPAPLRILLAVGTADAVEDAVNRYEARHVLTSGPATRLCLVVAAGQARAVAGELVGAGLLVGIGSPVAPSDAPAGYRTAESALAQATPGNRMVGWEDILEQGPLGLIDPAGAQRFATSFLGGLDTGQLDTLRCFLRQHGSHIKVADELGLHRNTVRKRLAAIEARLPGPLDDPQIRASAWIALQALPPS